MISCPSCGESDTLAPTERDTFGILQIQCSACGIGAQVWPDTTCLFEVTDPVTVREGNDAARVAYR